MINYDDNNGDSNDDDDDNDNNGDSNDDDNDDNTAEGWNGDYEYMELENVTFDLTRFFIFISFIEKNLAVPSVSQEWSQPFLSQPYICMGMIMPQLSVLGFGGFLPPILGVNSQIINFF